MTRKNSYNIILNRKEKESHLQFHGENKNLQINLTKAVKGLYSESYKTLKNEIKEDISEWRDILCSWIGRLT